MLNSPFLWLRDKQWTKGLGFKLLRWGWGRKIWGSQFSLGSKGNKQTKKRTPFLLLKIEFQPPLIFRLSVCCSSLLTFKGNTSNSLDLKVVKHQSLWQDNQQLIKEKNTRWPINFRTRSSDNGLRAPEKGRGEGKRKGERMETQYQKKIQELGDQEKRVIKMDKLTWWFLEQGLCTLGS